MIKHIIVVISTYTLCCIDLFKLQLTGMQHINSILSDKKDAT